MARKINQLDKVIIELLQSQGFIKKEAEACLKREVYQLQPAEITKIKNYDTHFGMSAKDRLIQEILDLRREALYSKLIQEILDLRREALYSKLSRQ